MNNETKIPIWPPQYTIKKHPLTRRVKLKASQQKGLELIVPMRFNIKHIPSILLENKAWIQKQLAALQIQPSEKELPDSIILTALNQTWKVFYIESSEKLKIIARPHQEIVLLGNINNRENCKKLLIAWVKAYAKIHLTEKLKNISEQIKLPYKKVTVRDQQTRWGSCTIGKHISLNYKLLFLPSHLATHILIHELCHTVYLDHSEKFWQLVEKFDSDFATHRRLMRKGEQFVPTWIL
jgi:predicted metal-dependent hydrolase